MRIISEYQSGIGSTTLSRKYNVRGCATILHWIHLYEHFGSKGVIVRRSRKIYSFKYKLEVLNWMKYNHESYPDTALHFNISSPSIINVWERRLENGDLQMSKNTYKYHSQNNDIKLTLNQQHQYDNRILKLMIKYRYHKLLKRHDIIYQSPL